MPQKSPRRPALAEISYRDLRLLHAVAEGRVECSGSAEPDFYIDGIPCCDHIAARALTRAGLIQADGGPCRRVVHLTANGEDALVAAVVDGQVVVTSHAG